VSIQKKENDSVADWPRPVAETRKGPESIKPGARGLLASGVNRIEATDTPTPEKLSARNAKLTLPIEQLVPSKLFNDVVEHVVANEAFGKKNKQLRTAISTIPSLKFIEAS
jgi:hypothetical protein